MRHSIISLALLFLPLTMQAQSHEFANYQRFAKENTELGKPAKGEKRVVFLGNSITEGWINQHRDYFTSHKYINRGIGGQTSYQFLLRFREDVLNLEPAVLVLNYGTNDIAENTGRYSEDITFGNVISMAELARAHGIQVILCSCLPAKNFGWRPQITDGMQKIRSLNARVKAWAEKNKVQYVDYFTSMLNADGTGMRQDLTPETVHPNLKGYAIMEGLIEPAIKKALKKAKGYK